MDILAHLPKKVTDLIPEGVMSKVNITALFAIDGVGTLFLV